MSAISSKLTYEHLQQMPDDGKRYEILEGELAVTPAPSTRHQRVLFELARFFTRVEDAGYGRAYLAPADVVLDETTVVQPDLFFIAKDRLHIVTEQNIQGPPDLAVEVPSETTRKRDLGAKLRLYAQFGISHYWVVDPDTRTVRTLRLADSAYQEDPTLAERDVFGSPLFPGITLPLAEVFAD